MKCDRKSLRKRHFPVEGCHANPPTRLNSASDPSRLGVRFRNRVRRPTLFPRLSVIDQLPAELGRTTR